MVNLTFNFNLYLLYSVSVLNREDIDIGIRIPIFFSFFSRLGEGFLLVKPKCLIYVNVRMIVHSA